MAHTILTRRALLAFAVAMAVPARAETWVTFAQTLQALIPPGFEAEANGTSLSVSQVEAVRTPLTMTLDTSPAFELHRALFPRRHGDIRFTTRNLGGAGSGGPEHELRALRVLSDGTTLSLLAQKQSEGRPDFEIALDLLASVHRATP